MKNRYLSVRFSHIVRHCSVGAIIRDPHGYLFTLKDIRYWTDSNGEAAGNILHYVERAKFALDIPEHQQLRSLPVGRILENRKIDGTWLPAIRFPSWTRCPECGLLYYKPWRDTDNGERPRCQAQNAFECHKKQPILEQVPWVLVHPNGYMADFPFHRFLHENTRSQCAYDWSEPYMRLTEGRDGPGWYLTCTRRDCRAGRRFTAFCQISFGEKTPCQPWLRDEFPQDLVDPVAEILEVNDVRVHSPINRSALIIPPESRLNRGTVVDRLYTRSHILEKIRVMKNPRAKERFIRETARDFACSAQKITEAIEEIEKGYPLYGKNFTKGMLLEDEHKALTEEIPDMRDDEDFVTCHHTAAWKELACEGHGDSRLCKIIHTVDHLVAVSRLKEILVFHGFQRMRGEVVPPDITGKSDWLPAIKLYGEGIFIAFNEKAMELYENQPCLIKRAGLFRERYVASGLAFEPDVTVSPRFLFLHTLSHLLIRQLETEAGYPAASLKERIYSASVPEPMSGILIYVAVPDVAGSLGGLSELARPQRFAALLSAVFDHAEWCSLDPVCSEHEGQGPHLLNRAACHGCALIPEPSCLYGNVLLDRIFIKGDESNGIPAFLDCKG